MGWLWTSSPTGDNMPPEKTSKTNTESKQGRSFALTEEQQQRIFGKPPTSISTPAEIQQADKEVEAFIDSWSGTTTAPTPATTETASQEPEQHPRQLPDGTLSIHHTHLYPRTMSCRQAFDQAFYCQSLGGKFNDIYRYGRLQDCSEQWASFWFCMRIRTLPMAHKEDIIAEHYADRERRRKKEYGSSEDVWELREKAVEGAFGRDPDAVGVAEAERGSAVRE